MRIDTKDFVAFAAGVACVILFVGLGRWQLDREAYKTSLQERADLALRSAPVAVDQWMLLDRLEGSPVSLEGVWRADKTVFLDNRVYKRQPGYFVITPLQLKTGGYVMVNRGWVRASPERKILPQIKTPAYPVKIVGVVHPPVEKGYSLGDSLREERIWQKIDIDRAKAWLGSKAVAPWLVFEKDGETDGLVRVPQELDFRADIHHAYALQWFSLALAVACLTGWGIWRCLFRNKSGSLQ